MVKNLKKLRNERGISQRDLADIIMVSQQSINKYENHNVEPDIDTLIKMADYFDVSLDYLVGREFNASYLNNNQLNLCREDLLKVKTTMETLLKIIDNQVWNML